MKKFALLFALIGIVNYSYTNSGGSPGGKSGSPASNGQTCSGGYCHSGGSPNGNELIDIKVDITPAAGMSNYSDTIRDSIQTMVYLDVAAAGSSKIGFSASIEDASGNHIGTLSTPSNTNTKITNTDYVTHKSSSIAVSNNAINWVWDWNTGDIGDSVTIYVAVNYTNGNGTTSGDYVVTKSKTLYPGLVMGQAENQIQSALNVYPSPAIDYINVKAEGLKEVRLYNTIGRFISMDQSWSATGNDQFDVSSLPRGNYILHALFIDGTIRYKHVVLQ
jgi:predicted CxxxxCH...CXXCH cytochrome family protein